MLKRPPAGGRPTPRTLEAFHHVEGLVRRPQGATASLRAVPEGFLLLGPTRALPILESPLFSPAGKLRMALDLLLPRGSGGDESVGDFVRRRLGRECYERLAQPLVTAIYGGDPNWGRVLAAAGAAGVPLASDRLTLQVAAGEEWLTLATGGATARPDAARAHEMFGQNAIRLRLDLGIGRAEAVVWTCDLTPDYIRINADYTS